MRNILIRPGDRLPEFTLPATDNTTWRGRDLLGAVRTLLIFFRRDCPACRTTLISVERMYRRLSRAGLQAAGIAQDAHADTLELADAFQITFPLLLDHPELALSREVGLNQVPAQILLDADGLVLETTVSFSRGEQNRLFRRLCRELARPEEALFQKGDLFPETLEGLASASSTGAEGGRG